MIESKITWQAHDGNSDKSSAWYWTIGIVAFGFAVAGFIIGNFLFGIMALLGGFAIMLSGVQPEKKQAITLSDKGVHIDKILIPYQNVNKFSIKEDDPKKLTIETNGLMGIMSFPLGETDFRSVRSQLKNNNVDEEDEIHSFTEKISDAIGM